VDVADVRANVLVLLEEALQVDNHILQNGEVGKRADLSDFRIGVSDAGERVDTIDVHGTATADTLAA